VVANKHVTDLPEHASRVGLGAGSLVFHGGDYIGYLTRFGDFVPLGVEFNDFAEKEEFAQTAKYVIVYWAPSVSALIALATSIRLLFAYKQRRSQIARIASLGS